MCISCGCGKFNENHGDTRNLTLDNLYQAANAAGITPTEAIRNMQQAAEQAPRQGT